ncbi:transmembrane protein, putative, partial [Bodo saltans]
IASGSVNSRTNLGHSCNRILSPQDPPASLPSSHVALDNHWQLRTGGPGESVGSHGSVNRAAAVVARSTAWTTKDEVAGDLSVEHELCICCPELQFPEIDEESGTDRGDGSGAESANQSSSHHRGGGGGGGGLNCSRSRRSVSTGGGGGAHQQPQQQQRQSIAFTVASSGGAETESVLAEIGARVAKGDAKSDDGLVRVGDTHAPMTNHSALPSSTSAALSASTKSTTNATTTSATTGDDAAALYSTAIGSFLSYRWFTDERTEAAYRSYTTHSATKADVIWTACSAVLSLSCLFATLVYSSIQEHDTIALIIASWVSCLALLMIAVLAPPPWFTSAMTSHLVAGGYATFARYLLSDAMIAQHAEYYYNEWNLWRVLDTPIAVLDHTSLRTVLYFVLWCMPMVSYATITFMVPSEGNIVGNSQLIWLIVMLNWSLVRPMWVRPVVAFSMDGVLCTAYFLRTFARFDTNPIARVTALYMEAAIFLYSGIVRLVLDSSMRAAFATELEAQQLKDILERDQKKLEGIVEMVATDGIASRFIEHSRRQRRDEVRRRRHNDGGLSSSLNAAAPLRQRVFREFAGWHYGAPPTTVTDRVTNSTAPSNHQLSPAPPPPPQEQLPNNSSTVSRSLNPLVARHIHEGGDAGNMLPSVASSTLETIGGVVNGIPAAFLILDADDVSRPITERGRRGAAVDELQVMVSPASPRTTISNNNNNNNNGRGGGTSAGRDEYLGESNINSSTTQRARFLTSNETVTTTAPSTVQDEAIHPKKPLQSDDGRQQLQLRPPVSSLYTLVAAQVTGATVVGPPPVVVINTNSPTNRLHRATNYYSASPPSPLSPRRDQHAIITHHSNNSHQGDHHRTLVTMTANHLNDDGAHPLKSTAWSTSVWEVPIAIIRLDRNLSLATRQRTTTTAPDLSMLRTSENSKSEGASHRPGEHRTATFKGKIPRLSIVSDGGGGYDDDGDDDEDEPAAAAAAAATSTELSSPHRVVAFDARRRSSAAAAEQFTKGGVTPRVAYASIPNNNVDVVAAAHQSTTAAAAASTTHQSTTSAAASTTVLLGDTILTTTDNGLASSSPHAALGLFSRAATVFDHSSGG